MGLLALLALLLMRESHLFHLPLKVLLFKLSHAILSHLSFDVASLSLALDAELLGVFNELSNIFGVHLLILASLRRVF